VLCYGFPNKGPACNAKDSPANAPLAPCGSSIFTKYVTNYDTNSDAHPHSTEQDTQPIEFLISKQAHTRHVVTHVVLWCLLLIFNP
jgi:hypothetical protein